MRFPAIQPAPIPSTEEKLRDEYDSGLDKTGPQWEGGDDQDEEPGPGAMLAAAGATAYYDCEVRP